MSSLAPWRTTSWSPLGSPPSLEDALRLARTTRAFAVRRDGEGRALVTYLYGTPELFSLPGARELRGIVYREEDGTVLSRPFHKFFNFGEPLAPGEEAFKAFRDSMVPLFVAEKVDGYLAQAYLDGGELRFASRHSLNPPLVGALLRKAVDEEAMARLGKLLAAEGGRWTALLEVVDPEAPVMVPYQEPGVYLLALRSIGEGHYLLPGVHFPLPEALRYVRWEPRMDFDPHRFRGEIRDLQGVEGYVVTDGAEFVKFKTGWAFRLARFLMDPEGVFLEAYAEDRLDDLVGALAGREDLLRAVARAQDYLAGLYGEAVGAGDALRRMGLPRKEAWARVQEEAGRWGGFAPAYARAAMAAYEGGEAREAFLVELRKRSARKALEALHLFPRVGGELRG
uniref:RNA ligase 1 n=1 Tax=Bacteriophage TS2126 TaxID=272473 RepID=RLIG_BPTS2|nr:RecName: Full=RNA ligase 1; AltName: Full=TS2126 RNA ligase 1 [Phage TS2126]